METTGLQNIYFKKFKAIGKDTDKSEDITTPTLSNSWLQPKTAKVCGDPQDILARDKKYNKVPLTRGDYKKCPKSSLLV